MVYADEIEVKLSKFEIHVEQECRTLCVKVNESVKRNHRKVHDFVRKARSGLK